MSAEEPEAATTDEDAFLDTATFFHTPWNDMVSFTNESTRGIGLMLETVVQAQNETNRLLSRLLEYERRRAAEHKP